jgi:hypothetical protein
MIRYAITVFLFLLAATPGYSQDLQKPDVTPPSLKKVKRVHYHKHSYGRTGYGGGYMGLFDWNFSLGYIDKLAQETFPGVAAPNDLATSGQYFMGHLQESVLSNYFLGKKSKRNRRVKFGFQDTFDLGLMRGAATDKSSDFTTNNTAQYGNKVSGFFNYEAGLAIVVRAGKRVDLGYTYYPYVNSTFAPGIRNYSKVRVRLGPVMGEYSFNGKTELALKYLRGSKLYFGLSYNKTEGRYINSGYGISNVSTNWFHISLGKVF